MGNTKVISPLTFGVGSSQLGTYLVASSDKGVRAILLGDSREELLDLLAEEFPSATLSEGGQDYEHVVERVSHLIKHPAGKFELRLDISGGDFEQVALAAVRSISVHKKPTLLE